MIKSGYVAIVGRPNVGKSTLLNNIIGEKISAISNKPQTTREKITFIYNDDESQIIFLDTPGIQTPKNKLGKFMLKESEGSLFEADIVTYIVDTSKKIGRLDRYIIDELKEKKIKAPIILLINKIDTIKKEELFEIISMYDRLHLFKEIIPISAMKKSGIDLYINALKENLKEGPLYYPNDMITDKSERFIVSEMIRESALRFLSEEIPHGIAISLDKMKKREDKDIYDIEANLYLEREAHKKIVIGKDGEMLKKIGSEARKGIENLLGSKINLKLWVKVEKNWRNNENKIKFFGYK